MLITPANKATSTFLIVFLLKLSSLLRLYIIVLLHVLLLFIMGYKLVFLLHHIGSGRLNSFSAVVVLLSSSPRHQEIQ